MEKKVRFVLQLLLTFCAFKVKVCQMCDVANVQVENEDGVIQVFEVKRLEPVKGDTCGSCSQQAVNAGPRLSGLGSSVFLTIGEAAPECDDKSSDPPVGLCSTLRDSGYCVKEETETCQHSLEDLATEIVERDLVPLASQNPEADKKLALGFVLLNMGSYDAAMKTFNEVLYESNDLKGAYYGRGMVYARRGLQEKANAAKSIREFTEVIHRTENFHEPFARRGEAYMAIRHYPDALNDFNKAIKLNAPTRIFFLRGVVNLLLENFSDAEKDFKLTLDKDSPTYITNLYHLGLAQYYRGRIRNAIEVFKEVLKVQPDHIDACSSVGQAYKELGNLRAARGKFNRSLEINSNHSLTLQLRANMYYYSGDPMKSLQDDQKCLSVDPDNIHCQYMEALSYIATGKFYEGLKSTTKVMVNNMPMMKATPEFLRAHYLREYGRYLHAHLEYSLTDLKLDEDLNHEFKDRWAKISPFTFKTQYKEQPGLQPEIPDVNLLQFEELDKNKEILLCKADAVGKMMQVNTDGYTPNKRYNLAMGLASIHIAQLLEAKWKGLRQNKQQMERALWRDVFNIAVQYRRLVDPEQPVLWLDLMTPPDNENYRTEFSFIRGSVHNIKLMQYFDLVFKLAKTMLEHYSGNGAVFYPELQDDIEKAKTVDDLLTVARKRQINQHGFMVSTQVPSSRKDGNNNNRLDGAMLILTDSWSTKMMFAIHVVHSKSRTSAYHAELDAVFNQLQEEIKRTGITKLTDVDSVVNIILTLVYYFYNLMPLTRGSSVVAYSVALGLLMSVGRQVTGKVPNGKLLEMEAMLSGAPDAFILVTKQWMQTKKLAVPVSQLPSVTEVFPTVRSIIEVLNVNTDLCS
ncbi:tetratricopeptide repeat protein 13-like [Mytilus trossulus]|uniref:tetratricopeptide repeat protein 13-like n=1 Tax=Mytilus trossulus TaxID=6551 RepID=UPI003007CC23